MKTLFGTPPDPYSWNAETLSFLYVLLVLGVYLGTKSCQDKNQKLTNKEIHKEATWRFGQSTHSLIPIQHYFCRIVFLLQFWIDGSQLINISVSDFSWLQYFTNLF